MPNSMPSAAHPMQRDQPNYSAADLATITVPVTVAQAENDEFIEPEHAEYIARTIPGARFELLAGVSHFAPVQRLSFHQHRELQRAELREVGDAEPAEVERELTAADD